MAYVMRCDKCKKLFQINEIGCQFYVALSFDIIIKQSLSCSLLSNLLVGLILNKSSISESIMATSTSIMYQVLTPGERSQILA